MVCYDTYIYNCLLYLEETLNSVLIQDPGEALMQIQVVDDCSTDGDVAHLVTTIGKGRVKYFRQEYNRGSLRNFETCLNLSNGQLIHLLHGDDCVKPGFYREIELLFNNFPTAGAAFTNYTVYHQNNTMFSKINPLAKHPGLLKNFFLRIVQGQIIQPPAMVVKRAVYEDLGSFFAVHFGEDWEMWTRISAHYPVAYSPKNLATYRFMTPNGITQLSVKSGQNVIDMLKVMHIIQTYLPLNARKKFKEKVLKNISLSMIHTAHLLYPEYKNEAFIRANEGWKLYKTVQALYYISKLYFKNWIGYKPKLSKRANYNINDKNKYFPILIYFVFITML